MIASSANYAAYKANGGSRSYGSFYQRRNVLRQSGANVTVTPQTQAPPIERIFNESVGGEPDGSPNWREMATAVTGIQKLRKRTSTSSDRAAITIETSEPIAVVLFSDSHFGDIGSDMEALMRFTEELVTTPNLYCILGGDMVTLAVKLRSVAEVLSNALTPEEQYAFLESWLDEVSPKVLAACWGNHEYREEALMGTSRIGRIYAEKGIVYHGGIGHLDLTVGDETYAIALSHHYRGRSILNPLHGQMRYAEKEAPDRELILAGDSHVPGMITWRHGGTKKLAINSGTLQTMSRYAKRFFSLTTHSDFPCVELDPKQHRMTGYWSVAEWLAART